MGFSTFFIDIAMGFLTMLFNRQIMTYLGTNALAVYGIIVNISTFVRCCGYGIGQASQPLLTINYGAKETKRVSQLVKYNLVTVAIVSIVWVLIVTSIPTGLVKLFMTPNDEVLRIAPEIIRVYGLSFFLLPFNVYATYYFQSTLQPFVSFMVSLLRGALLSGGLILLLPVSFGGSAIWWAMPLSELLTSVYVVIMMNKTRKNTLRLSTFAD